MYWLVVLFSQSFDDKWFTYKIPESLIWILKIWMIVKVPFWKNETYWVVTEITLDFPNEIKNIKEIIEIYSQDIFLLDYQIKMLYFICNNYYSLVHQWLSLFFPSNFREKIIKNKFSFSFKNEYKYTFDNFKKLNQHQEEIYNKIINSNNNKFLLYWVTGSGKTEIYVNLIKKYIDLWKQVLFLVPEIILTNQLSSRIEKVFWKDVIILNSTVTSAVKTKYYNDIMLDKAKIIIWTRSALFYPYTNLGLIIVDEEHDESYISDASPRYDWVEISSLLSDFTNSKLVLWSWTPKINHFYEWLKWKYEILYLFWEYWN